MAQHCARWMFAIATIYSIEMSWLLKSLSFFIQWTIKFTPDYKDGVCYSQTVEGCRDEFGVVYPVNYNVSHQFSFNHTNIVEQYLNASRPFLMNSAKNLFSEVIFQQNGKQQTQQQWLQQQSQQQEIGQQWWWQQSQEQQQSQQHGRFNISQTVRPSANKVCYRKSRTFGENTLQI